MRILRGRDLRIVLKAIKDSFTKMEIDFKKTEDRIKTFLRRKYSQAKTKEVNGEKVLQQAGNFGIMKEMNDYVKGEYKKLEKKYGKKHAEREIKKAYGRAVGG